MPTQFLSLISKGLRGPLLAALLAFVVGLPCALMMPPLDRDESRFAQASSQMLETHDFININLQKVPRSKKPVGIHWLQVISVALTSKVSARQIIAYRWPSLLGAALAAFACAWGASRAFDMRVGTKAGIIFAVTFMLSTEAFIAKTDAVLCGLTTLMMAALAHLYLTLREVPPDLVRDRATRPKLYKERLIFWLALAGTVLIKGPMGPLVLVTTLVCLWVWDTFVLKAPVRWIRYLGWSWGLCLVALICGPWAIAITITTDGAFWTKAIGQDLGPKMVGGTEGHFMWPGYHTLLLPVTLFPASLLFGGALYTALTRRTEPAVRFAIAWFLPAFIAFELFPTKLPHYPLPTFGGLIWLCALSLDMPLKLWAKIVNIAIGMFGGLVLTVVAVVGYKQFGGGASLAFVIVVAAAALIIAGLAGFLLWRDHRRTGFGFLLAAGILGHLGIVSLVASLTPLWMSHQMEQALIAAHLDPRQGIAPGPVATLGYSEPSFVFTMGTSTQLLNDDADGAVKALSEGRPLFVESRFQKPFLEAAAAQGITPHVISAVKGRNYSNGESVVITLYDNPPPVTEAP